MASIWFREIDGWWYVTRNVHGKRKQVKLAKGRKNKNAATEKLNSLEEGERSFGACPGTTFGDLAIAFMITSCKPQGISGMMLLGSGVGELTCFITTASGVSASNGRAPVTIWNSITPSE